VLETPFSLVGNPESALGNVLLEAMLAGTPGDIAILNVTGGIRAELPAGELTYGDVYEAFPFDNRTVVLPLTGRDVREVIARQVHKHGRRAGIGGLRVYVECQDDVMKVRLQLDDGREIADTDQVDVITNDFLALGGDGIFAPVMPASGFDFDLNGTLARRTFIDWFEAHAGQLHADDYLNPEAPRWNLPESPPESCTLPPR
jgi:5'-nucleotidase